MTDPMLTAYDEQLRGAAEVVDAPEHDTDGPLHRAVLGDSGFVGYRSLDLEGSALDALIARTIAHFRDGTGVTSFEWKTRGHDLPADLVARLVGHGFVAEEVETVMIGEAAALAVDVDLPAGVVVRRVDDRPDRVRLLHAAADLQRRVFGGGPDGAALLARVDRGGGRTEVWVAEAPDGSVICAGRLELVADTEFAGLWGGATDAAWRGRGIYRALTAARARSALARGARYLQSDCTEMSRPILERSGLRAVTTTTPYVWTRPRVSGSCGCCQTEAVLYRVVHSLVEPLAKAVWRPTVTGVEHVPPSGPVILASNHLSFADSVVLPLVAPRKVAFLAKSDYFTGSGIKGAISREWFEALGMLPVDRDDAKAALASLDTALEVLGRGEAFGIYPEGTRSRDGRLHRGRTGVAHLALTAGCPVVPVGLRGTDRLQPVGARLPRVVKVTVAFGEPIEVAGRYDGVAPGRARREVTDEVMAAIAALSGQEQSGRYNDRPPEA